jgi:hypothetical protein
LLQITPYYDTDFNLLRWLKGHNFNFEEILPKLRNHLTFRKSHWELDTLADKARNHKLHSYWQHGLTGVSGKIPNTLVNVSQRFIHLVIALFRLNKLAQTITGGYFQHFH